jgi:glutamate-1-semialdehyde 2,1-aminomutase
MSLQDSDNHFQRLREQTPESESYHERAREVTPLGVESNVRSTDPYPFYLGEAEESYVYDIDGNEYLDFLMGLGPGILGHNHPAVVERVKAQVEKCGDICAMPQTVAIDVMKQIKDMTPSIEKVRLANSGSEATMHAIRVARSYTGKTKIAKPEGGGVRRRARLRAPISFGFCRSAWTRRTSEHGTVRHRHSRRGGRDRRSVPV